MTHTATVGLRERKKHRTTVALQNAAYKLFFEKGYRKTTVDDIAAAAGVSTRTYYRYYRNKEDVVLGPLGESLERYREILAGRPSTEPPLQAMQESFMEFTSEVEDPGTRTRLELVAAEPELQRGAFELGRHWQDEITSDLAVKGHGGEADRRSLWLAAGMAITLWVGSLRIWAETGGKRALADVVGDTFGSIADLVKGAIGLF
jgi:AcrR family transcriptional regulator